MRRYSARRDLALGVAQGHADVVSQSHVLVLLVEGDNGKRDERAEGERHGADKGDGLTQ